jgi:hypothetical protein
MLVSGRAWGAVVLALGFVVGGMPAHANVTYSYSGKPVYDHSQRAADRKPYTGGVTFAGSLAPNSNYSVADVVDFSLNDGALTISKSNSRPGNEIFFFTTNAAGDIAFWNVQAAYQFPLTLEVIRMTTLNEPTLVPIDETEAVATWNLLWRSD